MIHSRKLESISGLKAVERYSYFVRKVADFEVVWGLFDDGWATLEIKGQKGIPFWPEEDFADLCATEDWGNYRPRDIQLDDFIEKWLPEMEKDGLVPAIFPTPKEHAFSVSAGELSAELKNELQHYE